MGIISEATIRIPIKQSGFNGKYPAVLFRGSHVPPENEGVSNPKTSSLVQDIFPNSKKRCQGDSP